jgi:hypothetical protein
MSESTSNPSPFEHLDTMIDALAGAENREQHSLYLRGIVRALEVLTGQVHTRLGALRRALSPGSGK